DAAGHHRSGRSGSGARKIRDRSWPSRARRHLRVRSHRGAHCAARTGAGPMKTALAAVLALGLSAPLAAQSRAPVPAANDEPSFALRPFFVLTGEKFAAK